MHDYLALEDAMIGRVTAAIRGGTADLRPLRAGEVEPLVVVFAGMSPASRLDRYLTGITRLTPSMLTALTALDRHDHAAWLASVFASRFISSARERLVRTRFVRRMSRVTRS